MSHGERLPDWLSCFPEKLACYATDACFLRGWAILTQLHRQEILPLERLWALGSVLFKADTVLRGNGVRGIRFLQDHGYEIRAAREVAFSESRVEQFWHYSLGRLSRERVELLKRLQTISPSLYLIVESRGGVGCLPCSLRVTELKGQVELARRHTGSLRFAMGDPQSAFFNFVHTADEPSDLVRELGLLFDVAQRRDLILEVISGSSPDVEGLYERLLARGRHSDLDFSRAVSRVLGLVVADEGLSNTERERFFAVASRLRDMDYASWLRLRRSLLAKGIQVDDIDAMVIAGGLVTMKQKSITQAFPSCEARHWENHRPLLNTIL
jgi:nucleoside diphosphate kinase